MGRVTKPTLIALHSFSFLKKSVKMCKTCTGGNTDLTSSSSGVEKSVQKISRPQARMTFPSSKKMGEQRWLPWKEAILQTTFLEDQERDILLRGWTWSSSGKMVWRNREERNKGEGTVDTVGSLKEN